MPSRAELVNRANVMGITASNYPNDSKLEQKVIWAETNASTMAGTLAYGTLTVDGDLTAGDQVLIGTEAQGGVTYTFVASLTGAKATGTITTTDVFADGETITINGVTYTMKATLSSPTQAYEVLIGASAAASLDNLKLAINQGGTAYPTAVDNSGVGSTWSTGTVRHPHVTATTNANDSQVVEAREFGTAAHLFDTVETCANASWGATKMSGGVANVLNEVLLGANAAASLDNLKLAINNSATEGTQYSAGTKAHPLVDATTNTDTTQLVTALNMAVGEDISTTDPVDAGTHLSWGATTLASGVADQNAVDATAKAQTSGGKNVG